MDKSGEAKFVYNFGAVTNPTCPYHEKIRKLRYGDILFFRGFVPSNCKRFDLNLIGQLPKKRADVAFHFNPRFDQKCTVRNSTENGKWGPEERTNGTARLKVGYDFEISFLVLEDKFRVAMNKQHYTDYEYRMPLASITAVKVSGDITFNSFLIQPSLDMKPIPKVVHIPLEPLRSKEKENEALESPPGDGMEHLPICYTFLRKPPYKAQIPGGMKEGRVIFATVIPSKASSRWTINLWTSRNSMKNLPLHFNVRHDEKKVVLNSTDENARWQEEVIPTHFPVMCGRHTDVVIVCEKDRYLISLHNYHFAEFKHRYTKLEDIRAVSVEGDCFLIHIRVQ